MESSPNLDFVFLHDVGTTFDQLIGYKIISAMNQWLEISLLNPGESGNFRHHQRRKKVKSETPNILESLKIWLIKY